MYEGFLEEEHQYLKWLKAVQAPDELKVVYMRALEELEASE